MENRLLRLLARQAGPAELAEAAADDPEALRLALRVHALTVRRHRREAGLAGLVDTARDLAIRHDLDQVLPAVTQRARRLLTLDMAWLTILEEPDGPATVRAASGSVTALTVGMPVPGDGSGAGAVARRTGAPFWTSDYLTDERITHSSSLDPVVDSEGLHALLAVPLRHGSTVFGVLYGGERSVRHFSPEELGLMCSLADLAGVALGTAELLSRQAAELDALRARGPAAELLKVLLAGDVDPADFLRRTLGPLLDHDARRGTELVPTLAAYFAAGGSPTRAAEALFVHPNTVARRLDRVATLLDDPAWHRPARALDLQLALRLHHG
ncbi:helix-turn-helix domain-containing protein [Kitasatospora sp. NPDC052896]|uniref:helix-turn-helix domain-containing protein n=1 Tax=Kitasatospora sp. NPDC052896 TaxID=3364061 RepID=UPI0037C9B9F0